VPGNALVRVAVSAGLGGLPRDKPRRSALVDLLVGRACGRIGAVADFGELKTKSPVDFRNSTRVSYNVPLSPGAED
jgi:hypothetical protein